MTAEIVQLRPPEQAQAAALGAASVAGRAHADAALAIMRKMPTKNERIAFWYELFMMCARHPELCRSGPADGAA